MDVAPSIVRLSFKNGLQTSVCYEERSGAILGCQITIIIGG